MELSQIFAAFQHEALTAISSAHNAESLEQVRIEFLGKKQGKLKDLQANLAKVLARVEALTQKFPLYPELQ